MEFSIGYITPENTLIKKSFLAEGKIETEEYIDLMESVPFCDSFVVSEESDLELQNLNTPNSIDRNIGLCLEDFNLIDSFLAAKINEQIENQWTIANNLNSIKNIFEIAEGLKSTLAKGREAFFNKLWEVLFLNYSPTELRIIFKDLRKEEKKEILEVKSLFARRTEDVKVEIENELDKALLSEYDEQIPGPFHIQSLKAEKRELVASVRIGGTPVLIMLKTKNPVGRLQESFFKALFKGIELPVKAEKKGSRKLH